MTSTSTHFLENSKVDILFVANNTSLRLHSVFSFIDSPSSQFGYYKSTMWISKYWWYMLTLIPLIDIAEL